LTPENADAFRRRFLAGLSYVPDPFQEEAFGILDAGRSVLVSAPTGSGKTLIAAYGVARARQAGGKAFYTTPLKALSNQKFAELVDTYGDAGVGLLTGDTAIRPQAPVVVMTTEVLRNMLLAGSDLLEGLKTVVLDEVHYLQDPYRGGVWEEVLVLCGAGVQFVCLSATVANATELGAWLRSVRGPTDVVVESQRPISLRHHFAVHRRGSEETELLALLDADRPAGDGLRLDQAAQRALRTRPPRWQGGRSNARLPFRTPRRTEVIELLDDEELLPAIVFIFSRVACDDAVRQCLRDGLRLTGRGERARIREIAETHTSSLSDDDLKVLGYGEWLEGLEAGIAAHHAGMVPAFREAVEQCFALGLLRVVFATETLSLGINMPARTVVIERFTKFGSAGRATLTSTEYAQLTGRAGRRGLDDEGHAVVLWTPETTFAEVARVATAPPGDLRSAFRPTYNLAANLVRRNDRATATELLRRSFAQWQARGRLEGDAGTLVDLFGRRLAVLEELGYVSGWRLTDAGARLIGIYHETDLLVAEAVGRGLLEGAEPSVVAGVLSAMVFEKRRVRRTPGDRGRSHHPPARHRPSRPRPGDRLGERRRQDLDRRLGALAELGELVRAVEEVHRVPRTREPVAALAAAVASWVRGCSLSTVLAAAAEEVGELAPGDFVRTAKQVADLAGQLAPLVPGAAEAARSIVRDVVAASAVSGSATSSTPRS
jgi:ATP-dependent RNA helicase HelY